MPSLRHVGATVKAHIPGTARRARKPHGVCQAGDSGTDLPAAPQAMQPIPCHPAALSVRTAGRLAALLVTSIGVVGTAQLLIAPPPGVETAPAFVICWSAIALGLVAWIFPWDRLSRLTQLAILVLPAATLISLDLSVDSSVAMALWALFAAHVWLGMTQPRWTAVKLLPVNALACIIPVALNDLPTWQGVEVALMLPLAVVVAEMLSWISADLANARALVEQSALVDPLTGLQNRRAFESAIRRAVQQAGRRDTKVALAIADLDSFKEVNDTLGHVVGDAVLAEAARRMAGAVRASDLLTRVGGDEFALLIEDVPEDLDGLLPLLSRLRDTMDSPMHVDGREVSIGLSVGAAVAKPAQRDTARASCQTSCAECLFRDADRAMYASKHADITHLVIVSSCPDPV